MAAATWPLDAFVVFVIRDGASSYVNNVYNYNQLNKEPMLILELTIGVGQILFLHTVCFVDIFVRLHKVGTVVYSCK